MFLLVLIAGTSIIHLGSYLLYRLVHMTPVGFVDSGLGCAFGLIKGIFLSGLVAIAISFAPPESFLKCQYEKSCTAKPLVLFLSDSVPLLKKAVTSLYQQFAPLQRELEKKQNDGTIPPNFI